MLKNQPIILGIDPGARQIGIAVLRCNPEYNDGELLYYGIKTLKKDELRKSEFLVLERIITNLMNEFKVDYIALEKVVSAQQRNSFVESIYQRVKAIAQKYDFRIKEYSPKFVRSSICGKEKGTRQETYNILAEKYPELSRYLLATKDWQKSYFAHLFDAIAVALLCVRELNEESQLSGSLKE
jgi:Holliday junction resolvasome RuvABC endonuclease subunit